VLEGVAEMLLGRNWKGRMETQTEYEMQALL
jgi:hypothetical protein